MKGIINLYKPSGFTSSDAVVKTKKILNERTVGHMGTLDPMGEGVLPLGVGKGARLFDYFLRKDKLYRATFRFGYETDTLDRCGEIIADGGKIPLFEDIKEATKNFIGTIRQLPPRYSAKSINGEKAYKKARRGENFELKPTEVTIYSLDAEEQGEDISLTVKCSAGTYIRSIGRDLAHYLNTFCTMTSIVRLQAGPFRIEDCITFDSLEKLKEKAIIPLERVLRDVKRIDVPSDMYFKLSNGISISTAPFTDKRTVFCRGELFGLGSAPEGQLKIETYLKD